MLFVFVIDKKKMTIPQDQGSPPSELVVGKPYEDISFFVIRMTGWKEREISLIVKRFICVILPYLSVYLAIICWLY